MTQAEYGKEDQTFQAAGGIDGIQQLVEDFYGVMSSSDYAAVIRHMHPGDLTVSIDKLQGFFVAGWAVQKGTARNTAGSQFRPPIHTCPWVSPRNRHGWVACAKPSISKTIRPS